MWKLSIPPKVKMFARLLIHGRLNTRKRMNKFVKDIPIDCPIYKSAAEDQTHLFLSCNHARLVWNLFPSLNETISSNAGVGFNEWLDNLSSSDRNELSDLSKVLTICWQIWNDRNNVIIRQETHCPTRTHIIALSVGQEFFKANFRVFSTRNPDNFLIIKWHPPDKGFLKLNLDGSVSNAKAGAGFVVRNEDGLVIGAGAFNLNGAIINEAEARALKEGLTYIKRKGFNKVLIEGDSKLIIGALQGTVEPPWNIRTCLDDIKWFASACSSVIWKHTFREANFLGDAFAKYGLISSNSHYWEYCIPNFARSTFLFDSLGNGCKRGFLF